MLGEQRRLNKSSLHKARRRGRVHTRLHGPAAGGLARAMLLDGWRAAGLAAHREPPLDHAVVLAVPAAARRQRGLRVARKERRHQHPTKERKERECNGAPHDSRRIEDERQGRSAAAVTGAASQQASGASPESEIGHEALGLEKGGCGRLRRGRAKSVEMFPEGEN